MFFLDLDAGTKVIRKFGAIICDVIYTLISKVYELFITVARLNILSSPQIQPIYQRVTMILTIVMVFYITFEFVKYTISPDTITDKEKGAGNILKRVIIVISLIALVPEIFTTAYKLQNRIIETQLISKVILGTSSTDYTTYGNEFSANTLNLFYYYDEDACSSSSAGLINECGEAQKTVTENLNKIRTTGDSDIVTGINLASGKATFKEVNPAIKFNGILAIIVGGFILYILVMYSIDVGTRYAQLIFLQVISPIAIMGYILPKKDGIFQKWGKQCITTYIDLFLRIAIINFVLLIVKVLGDGFESGNIFSGIGNVSGSLKTFTYIVLVMGLLVFAQRAPKLLGELFPSSGAAGIGMGLGAKNRFEPTTKALKKTSDIYGTGRRVVGGAGGALAGAWKNRGNGLAGIAKGAAAGAKAGSSKNRKGLLEGSVWRRMRAAGAAGEGVDQSIKDFKNDLPSNSNVNVRDAMVRSEHYKQEAREQDRQAANYDAAAKGKDNIAANVKEIKVMKKLDTLIDAAKNSGDTATALKLEDQKKKVEKALRVYAVNKNSKDENVRKVALNDLQVSIVDALKETGMSGKLGNIGDYIEITQPDGTKVKRMVTQIDPKTGKPTSVTSDMESIIEGDSAIWNSVTTSIDSAENTIKAVLNSDEDTIKIDGKDVLIRELTKQQLVENISEIEKIAKAKAIELRESDIFKDVHAAAKGINDGGKSS